MIFFVIYFVCVCVGGGPLFCKIQCKLYYNNLHKHAPSIKSIFLAFGMKN